MSEIVPRLYSRYMAGQDFCWMGVVECTPPDNLGVLLPYALLRMYVLQAREGSDDTNDRFSEHVD